MGKPKITKDDLPKGVYSITENAELIDFNRERVRKAIRAANLKPYAKIGSAEYYWLKEVVRALMEKDELDLQQERAKLAKEQRKRTRLQNEELEGVLVNWEEKKQEWIKYIASCRAKLLSLPVKLAPLVHVAETTQEAKDIIKSGVYEALNELAEG